MVKMIPTSVETIFCDQLTRSVDAGDLSQVADLLERGANVNHVARWQCNTPLIIAMYLGHRDVMRALITHKADVYKISGFGTLPNGIHRFEMCPMSLAAMNDNAEMAEIIMPNAIGWDDRDKFERCLRIAAVFGSSKVLNMLLDQPICTLMMNNAILQDDHNLVDQLCSLGFNTTKVVSVCGKTPLALALLVKTDIDMGLQNESYAAFDHSLRIIQILLMHGADCNEKLEFDGENNGYTTFLHDIIMFEQLDCLKLFLSAGADVKIIETFLVSDEVTSAIEFACQIGRLNCVKVLIAHGVNINEVYQSGFSALAKAIKSIEPDIVEYLIECGADYQSELRLARNLVYEEVEMYDLHYFHDIDHEGVITMEEFMQTCILRRIRTLRAVKNICTGICVYVAKKRNKRNTLRARMLHQVPQFRGVCSGYNSSLMNLIVDHLEELKWPTKFK